MRPQTHGHNSVKSNLHRLATTLLKDEENARENHILAFNFAEYRAIKNSLALALVDRLDRVSRKYSLLINVEKTKVMLSDGIACRILIQNELLEQVDTFPYLGSLITVDGECTAEFRARLNRGQAIGASLQKIWKSYSIPISTKILLMKALV